MLQLSTHPAVGSCGAAPRNIGGTRAGEFAATAKFSDKWLSCNITGLSAFNSACVRAAVSCLLRCSWFFFRGLCFSGSEESSELSELSACSSTVASTAGLRRGDFAGALTCSWTSDFTVLRRCDRRRLRCSVTCSVICSVLCPALRSLLCLLCFSTFSAGA